MTSFFDLDELKEKARKLVGEGRRKGADTVEVEIHRFMEFEVEVRNQEVETLVEAESSAIALTVTKDGKRASTDSSDMSPENLDSMLDRAITLCRYTDRDPFYSLPKKELLAFDPPVLDIFDESLPSMRVEEKIKTLLELERMFLGIDKRVKSDSCSLSTMISARVLANSLDFCAADMKTSIGVGAFGFAEDQVVEGDLNTGRKQSSGWSTNAHYLEDLCPAEELAQQASSRIVRKLGARKPKTGQFPVYFEQSIAEGLWKHLMSALTGTSIYKHESYLVDRLNTKVCADHISLTDDPFLPRGLGSKAFDREGVACKKMALVTNGVLNTYLLGTYAANKLNMQGTGHAGGVRNLIVTRGDKTEAELLKEMGTGVWITSVLGQGANISNGDYSRGAQGLWVENGEVVYPVMEFTINSNLDQMFKNITHLGSEIRRDRSTLTPGFIIGEMTVSGE